MRSPDGSRHEAKQSLFQEQAAGLIEELEDQGVDLGLAAVVLALHLAELVHHTLAERVDPTYADRVLARALRTVRERVAHEPALRRPAERALAPLRVMGIDE